MSHADNWFEDHFEREGWHLIDGNWVPPPEDPPEERRTVGSEVGPKVDEHRGANESGASSHKEKTG